MEERRKLERFELTAPASVLIQSLSEKREHLELTTRDISSAGAFLFSSRLIPEGSCVKIELMIALDARHEVSGGNNRAKVRVKGKVLRSDSSGIAIRFDGNYKITSLATNTTESGLS